MYNSCVASVLVNFKKYELIVTVYSWDDFFFFVGKQRKVTDSADM